MRHNYIDPKLVYDFSKKIDIKTIYYDLVKNYRLDNMFDYDDELAYWLAEVVLGDYKAHRYNYLAFIEKGMNVRVFAELRKNAMIYVGDGKDEEFFTSHRNANTVEEISLLRYNRVHAENKDYMDYEWQQYFLIDACLRGATKNFTFKIAACFADRAGDDFKTDIDLRHDAAKVFYNASFKRKNV